MILLFCFDLFVQIFYFRLKKTVLSIFLEFQKLPHCKSLGLQPKVSPNKVSELEVEVHLVLDCTVRKLGAGPHFGTYSTEINSTDSPFNLKYPKNVFTFAKNIMNAKNLSKTL